MAYWLNAFVLPHIQIYYNTTVPRIKTNSTSMYVSTSLSFSSLLYSIYTSTPTSLCGPQLDISGCLLLDVSLTGLWAQIAKGIHSRSILVVVKGTFYIGVFGSWSSMCGRRAVGPNPHSMRFRFSAPDSYLSTPPISSSFYNYESPFHPHLLLFPFYSTPHRQILYEREREKILILGENCGRVRRVSSSLLPEASVSRPPPSFPPLSIYSLGNLFGRVGFASVDRSIERASERRLVSRYAPPIRCDFEFLTTVS